MCTAEKYTVGIHVHAPELRWGKKKNTQSSNISSEQSESEDNQSLSLTNMAMTSLEDQAS